MTPDELERLIADRVGRLPTPAAPAALHRRVMTAVSATRPVVRPWSIWPHVWQTTFALGLLTVAASATLAWSIVASNADDDAWWQIATRAVVGMTGALGTIRGAGTLAASGFAGWLASPAVLGIIAIVAGAAIALAVLAAWLSRVAWPPLTWSKGASR
jgi:hypothetical protein